MFFNVTAAPNLICAVNTLPRNVVNIANEINNELKIY